MKFANGNTAEWDFIHHDGAAAVVPVMDDGKILMVTQYRNALERDTLEIPAGKDVYKRQVMRHGNSGKIAGVRRTS